MKPCRVPPPRLVMLQQEEGEEEREGDGLRYIRRLLSFFHRPSPFHLSLSLCPGTHNPFSPPHPSSFFLSLCPDVLALTAAAAEVEPIYVSLFHPLLRSGRRPSPASGTPKSYAGENGTREKETQGKFLEIRNGKRRTEEEEGLKRNPFSFPLFQVWKGIAIKLRESGKLCHKAFVSE